MDLSGKKTIVTGGVRGLGRAMVERLISKQAVVTVFDLNAAGLKDLQTVYDVTAVECDVSNYEQVCAATAQYHEKFGAADVLINNAGVLYSEPLIKIAPTGVVRHDATAWDKIVAANLSSVFYMTSCVVEKMVTTRTRGVVVNISSVAAGGNPGASAYSAAKAGVSALTSSWAKELGPYGIRVVAVAPGFIDTESAKEAASETALRETIKRVPLRRLGMPEEIAAGVIAALENDFFNGKVFELDGGLVI